MVITNMSGDILSDLAAEMTGGLGLGGALNAGEAHAVAQVLARPRRHTADLGGSSGTDQFGAAVLAALG